MPALRFLSRVPTDASRRQAYPYHTATITLEETQHTQPQQRIISRRDMPAVISEFLSAYALEQRVPDEYVLAFVDRVLRHHDDSAMTMTDQVGLRRELLRRVARTFDQLALVYFP
jgi:hypothetical protein